MENKQNMTTQIAEKKQKLSTKQLVGCILVILLLVIGAITGPLFTLTLAGTRAIFIFFSFLIAFFTGILPGGMAAWFFTLVAVFYGVFESKAKALGMVSLNMMLFAMGCFALTYALSKTSIPHRIGKFCIKISKGNNKLLILSLMLATAILSSVMTNMASAAAIANIANGILDGQKESKAGNKNLGRCMMIGIALASGCGGMMTPIGSILNMTVANMYVSMVEGAVVPTFAQWMGAMFIPGIVATIVSGLLLMFIFKPEEIDLELLVSSSKKSEYSGKLTTLDKKVLVITVITLAAWLSTTWISKYDTYTVALFCLVAFMLPGINVYTGKELVKNLNWDIVFLAGGIMALVQGLVTNDVAKWFGQLVVSAIPVMPAIIAAIVVLFFAMILRAFVPIGSPVAAALMSPVIALCGACGLNPVAGFLLIVVSGNLCTLLPIDLVPLMTYDYGYYEYNDYPKMGVPMTIVLAIVIPIFLITSVGLVF